jgi:hypothetical protein
MEIYNAFISLKNLQFVELLLKLKNSGEDVSQIEIKAKLKK